MKFDLDRNVFGEAVAWAARVLPARPAMPVLSGVLIEASEAGELTLSGFDYEVSARATVEAAVAEPGRALVPGRLLADIARSLPGEPVRVGTAGAETVVTCGAAEFGLQAMPAEDYPLLPAPPPAAGTVEGDEFAAAVARVVVAASRDDTLPMLTGVRLDVTGETLRLACTDRYRIAAAELSWTPAAAGFEAGVVVPARTLADVAKALKPGTTAELALTGAGDTLLGLSNAGRRITTRLLDDQFIDYRARLTADWDFTAEVRLAPFVEAVRRVALVTERNAPVRLAFSGGSEGVLRIRAATGEAARANEAIDASLDGDDIDLALNPHLLLDGLAGVKDPTVRLRGTTPTKPVLISGPDDQEAGYRYLVMPIRLTA